MKGVAPRGTSFGQIYLAAAPFVVINTIVMALLIIFPGLVKSALDFIG